MKVTHVGTLPPLLGISEVTVPLVDNLKEDFEIQFISFKSLFPKFLHPAKRTLSDLRRFRIEGIEWKYIMTYYNPFTWFYAALSVKGFLIHLQWWTPLLFPFYLPFLLISKLKRRPIILQVHNVFPHERRVIDRKLTGFVFSLCEKIVVHTEQMRKEVLGVDIEESKVVLIPFGMYEFYKRQKITKEAARKKLGIGKEAKVILFFGNIRKYKGLDLLIKAFPYIKKELPSAILLVAGRKWGDFSSYERLIEEAGVRDSVMLHLDYVPDDEVQTYFEASDIVALPYRTFTSLSGVAMVAFSFGKPIVASDVGSLRELVADERALLPLENPLEMSRKIISLLKDEKLLEEILKKQDKVRRRYSWEETKRRFSSLYLELLSKG